MLGPIEEERTPRRLGLLAGKIKVAEDFNDPLPPEILRPIEGEN